MTVQLVTNEKIAETSSKGNQEKWFDGISGLWYKRDQFGYESLSEVLVSRLLERSNVESDFPFRFVRYEMERLLDAKVNLKLWVKVKKDWRDSDFLIKNFGYHDDDK